MNSFRDPYAEKALADEARIKKMMSEFRCFNYGEPRGEPWVCEITDWLEEHLGEEDKGWVWRGCTIYVPHDIAVVFRLRAGI